MNVPMSGLSVSYSVLQQVQHIQHKIIFLCCNFISKKNVISYVTYYYYQSAYLFEEVHESVKFMVERGFDAVLSSHNIFLSNDPEQNMIYYQICKTVVLYLKLDLNIILYI